MNSIRSHSRPVHTDRPIFFPIPINKWVVYIIQGDDILLRSLFRFSFQWKLHLVLHPFPSDIRSNIGYKKKIGRSVWTGHQDHGFCAHHVVGVRYDPQDHIMSTEYTQKFWTHHVTGVRFDLACPHPWVLNTPTPIDSTHHVVGVGFDLTRPHPRVLLSYHAQLDALLGVKSGLFVGAAHHHVLALTEPAETTRVVTKVTVLTDLQGNAEGCKIRTGE